MSSRGSAEELAETTGRRVVWCADAACGFARLLADGETETEAQADFEAAGERVIRSEVFGE